MLSFVLIAFAMIIGSANAATRAVVVGVDAPALEGVSAVAGAAFNCLRASDAIKDSDSEVRALCAENASRDQMMTAFTDAANQASDGDTVFFAWLGHGYTDQFGDIGLVPFDWDPEDDTKMISVNRDLKPIIRLKPGVRFVIILDANHRANYRWTKVDEMVGYVPLHGPTTVDFADLDNVLTLSAGAKDNYLDPSDSKFGTAVVAALGARENGVLTIAGFVAKLTTVYLEAGGNPAGAESWKENSSVLFTWPAEVPHPPKQALKWRRPVIYAGAGLAVAGAGVSSVKWLRVKSLHQRLIEGDYKSINGDDGYYDIVDQRNRAFRGYQIGAVVGAVGAIASGTAFALEWRAGRQTGLTPMIVSGRGVLIFGRF